MSARGSQSGSARPQLTASLLRAWRTSVPVEDWRSFDAAALRRDCAAHLQFGKRRRRRQTLLRVSSAPVAATDAAHASYSVIELVIEDMPFLVDTLSMTLAQLGLSAQLIIHPVLRVWRDAAGLIRSLHAEIESTEGTSGGARESWQYWRIDRIGDAAECEQLRRRLLSALADVRRVCGDWMRMRNAVLKLCADISRHPPPLAADVIAESRALLQYMESHHFTFIGFRESRLRRRRGGLTLVPLPGTALGLLRRRFPGPQDSGIVTANIRRALRSPELLIITKANHRSTVHRPGYLDYIGVKRYDERGRVIGEARILGVWTSHAFTADPRQVPWLRFKLKRVLEHFPFAPNSHDGKRLSHIVQTLPRDELFQASVPDLIRCARAVLVLQERSRVRLIMRRDEFRRFWSCLVFMPRERCDSAAQAAIEALVRSACHGLELESTLSIGESPLAQLHIVVRVDPAADSRVNADRLERDIAAAIISWRDRLRSALLSRFGETQALALERRYAGAFPASYRQDVDAAQAVDDIIDLEGLAIVSAAAPAAPARAPAHHSARGHPVDIRRAADV
jgi:glutamate dehydrogenase